MDWGIVIGIAGILVAIYTYIRTRSIKSLVYDTHIVVAFDRTRWRIPFSDISLQHNGNSIERLSRSYFLLWNGGNNTIEFGAYLHDLDVSLGEEATIFGGGIVKSDDDANGAIVRIDPAGSNAKLRFNYLRSRDGIIFFVDHNARPEKVSFKFLDKQKDLTRRARIDKQWNFAFLFVPLAVATISLLAVAMSFRGHIPQAVAGETISWFMLAGLVAGFFLVVPFYFLTIVKWIPGALRRYFLFRYGGTVAFFYGQIARALLEFRDEKID